MILACIPCYNEENTIAKVILQARRYVDKILVCDDGSADMSGEIARSLGAIVITHPKNLGYGAALQSLFSEALKNNPDVIVTLDADGQHDPNDIPKLVDPILKGQADVVIGSRFEFDDKVPKYRKVGIKALTELSNRLSGMNIRDAQSGFRAYSGKALSSIRVTEESMGASGELLLKLASSGMRIIEVPIKVSYEGLEAHTKNPVMHGLEVIVGLFRQFSIKHPLLIFGIPSLVLMIIGLFFGLWAARIYLYDHQFPMGLTLASVFSIIIGAILGTTAILLFTLIHILREREK